MNWKRKFQNFVLELGQSYYKRSRVRSLTCQNGVYRAQVVGSFPYDVEIRIQDGDLIDMKCSCPYAASGQKCKHMAAAMFAIEAESNGFKQMQLPVKPEEKKVRPFETVTEAYRYYDMGRIAANFEFPEKTVAEAQRLIQKKKVMLDRVNFGYTSHYGDGMPRGVVYGHCEGERYPWELSSIFDRNRIIQASCGDPTCGGHYEGGYYGRKELCKHLLALLFLLEDYLKKYNPGDSTDRTAATFLASFRDQHVRTVLEQQSGQVRDFALEPVLEKDEDALYVSFKAGTERMYVVKKLTEFVSLYDNKNVIAFGTKTEIDSAKHRISVKSEAIYDYLRRIITDERKRAESVNRASGYYIEDGEVKNRIPLYGERLDQFYDLCEGKVVLCNDKSGRQTVKKELRFQDGRPEIWMQIEKDMDGEKVVHGIKVKGELPEFIQGNIHRYYFTQDAFCRMAGEMEAEILPLLESAGSGSFSFSVGRKNLSEFYHEVLPVLKRNVLIKEIAPEAMQEYIPPEAVFAFYLDAENGVITCKPKAHYGENTVSLLDNLRENSIFEDFRSRGREEEILYFAQQLFREIDLQKDEIYSEESEEAVLQLLDGGVDRLMALGEVHTTERFRNMNVRKKVKLKVGVSVESEIMNLSISSEDIDQEELLEILKSYQRRKKFYRLKNGNFAEVNETDIEMLGQMMETMHLSPKDFVKGNMKVPVYRALYLNKMLEQSEEIYLNRDSHFKKLIKEFKTVDDSDFEVPNTLSGVMRNYQVRGFKWLKTLEHYGFGGILADDMGLGKTLQMISVLLSAKECAKERGEAGTALIISPASLVYNWNQEFARFAPELKVTMVVGSQQDRAEIIHNYQNSDVLVTSYDLLKRDIAEYEGASFSYQVLDEAQYIKNHSTAAAKAVKIIRSKHRYALTGTPIENRLSELWSIFDYLMPGFLYGYETFRKELETPIVKRQDDAASERLKKMVSPFILRRLKGDVLKDLPDKIEEIRYAKLETEQQQLYDGQVLHMQNVIASQDDGDFQKNKLQILAELTRIRQICCDPELLFEAYKGTSAKRIACMELIQSAIEGEHKILVFSQFTSMLELLERDLNQVGIAYYKITGGTPKENRVEMVSAFNQDSTPVFLISLKAGGTGLNLTGADVVIHYDPWWNQAAQNQATDRAHRIGQTKMVSVYKLIAKDTIEEKIVKMQETKKNLADTVLSGENGGIAQMSREELIELLG